MARKLKLNIYIVVVCFVSTYVARAQEFLPNADFGAFAGASYYMGDINPRGQFYRPGLALGAVAKFNFTEFHSVRLNAFWGQLKGDDLDFNNEYQQIRAHNFETTLLDVHAGYEFNFIPYIVKRNSTAHTAYVFAAAGYSLILASTEEVATNHVTIPFGVGFKYRFSRSVTLGGEWGWRKTFNDTIDGLGNPGGELSVKPAHNNDWYSFAGVYLTFRIFEKGYKCPGIPEPRTFK